MILPLFALACVTAQGPEARPEPAVSGFVALAPAELEAQVKALLQADETLARPPIAGAVGPSPDCAVATVTRGPRAEIGLVLACGQQVFRSEALQSWAGDQVGPTLLADTDGDGLSEIVVMATWMTGIGPEGAVPFQANSVMRWDGAQLSHDEAAEARVGELSAEEKVRGALNK